jgi:5-formyltetrahydrofolate cyclo-ligase
MPAQASAASGLDDDAGMTGIESQKQAVREQVWTLLEDARVVEPGVRGYIPAFSGAEEAAARLGALPAWRQAQVLKVVPDRAQLPVRILALEQGKLVYMAVPRLSATEPYYVLDPAALAISPAEAARHDVAARVAPLTGTDGMRLPDLIVVGSVAVNPQGARLGKGAGYSDIEMALLAEVGLLTDRTVIATTMHELQVLHASIPEARHDFRVGVIVTPERVIWCDAPRRPRGIDWQALRPEQVAAIPALAHLRNP